jgi:hypothetical protein
MNAGPHCCRLALFIDVVAAILDESPGIAIAHHRPWSPPGRAVLCDGGALLAAAARLGPAPSARVMLTTVMRLHELRPEVQPLTSRMPSENGPRLVATDLIAASVMAAALRAESGVSRRPLNPSAA